MSGPSTKHWADWYITAIGCRVLPLWSTTPDGICQCPKGAGCDQKPGKHPRWVSGAFEHGAQTATSDLERIAEAFNLVPQPNLGVVPPADCFGWDLDGDDAERIASLEGELGRLPQTFGHRTPNGRHAIYRWPQATQRPSRVLDVVTRWGGANGDASGYLVGAGSRIGSAEYELLTDAYGQPLPVVDLPTAWVEAARAAETTSEGEAGRYQVPDHIPAGHRYPETVRYVASRYKRGITKEEIRAGFLKVIALRFDPPKSEAELQADLERAWKGTAQRLGPPNEYDDEELEPDADVASRLGWRPASELDSAAPPPLLLDRLDPQGHTILFGGGGVGKGVEAAHWSVELARTGHRVLLIDYENHPDEWGRRLYGLGAWDLGDSISHVAPHTPAFQAASGAIWNHAKALRVLIEQQAIDFVVIDSIVFACPGYDPSDPDTVSSYAQALATIGVPALSLAHVPKAGKELVYPFGSAFWHNQARMTWSLERDGEHILLTMRKANNYRRVERLRVTVTWFNERPVEVVETPYQRVIQDRIRTALGKEALSVKDITTRVNEALEEGEKQATFDTVRRTLNRNSGEGGFSGVFRKEGDKWQVI